jgi:hypothetical protein
MCCCLLARRVFAEYPMCCWGAVPAWCQSVHSSSINDTGSSCALCAAAAPPCPARVDTGLFGVEGTNDLDRSAVGLLLELSTPLVVTPCCLPQSFVVLAGPLQPVQPQYSTVQRTASVRYYHGQPIS